MNKMRWLIGCGLAAAFAAATAHADERMLAFSSEPDVLAKGQIEFEQKVYGKFGKDKMDYARWDFREEIEWGLTDRLTTALYLNFRDTYKSPHDKEAGTTSKKFEFRGVSSEWKYLILSPYQHPVGILAYLEGTTDGAHQYKLEEKLVFGTAGEVWTTALNLVLEQEWEREYGETEKESEAKITAGVARKLGNGWATGLEVMHVRGYEGTALDDEVYTATFAGPNIHYASQKWWVTFAVMPQVYGDGEGAKSSLNLSESHRIETRLLAGIVF